MVELRARPLTQGAEFGFCAVGLNRFNGTLGGGTHFGIWVPKRFREGGQAINGKPTIAGQAGSGKLARARLGVVQHTVTKNGPGLQGRGAGRFQILQAP